MELNVIRSGISLEDDDGVVVLMTRDYSTTVKKLFDEVSYHWIVGCSLGCIRTAFTTDDDLLFGLRGCGLRGALVHASSLICKISLRGSIFAFRRCCMSLRHRTEASWTIRRVVRDQQKYCSGGEEKVSESVLGTFYVLPLFSY